MNDQPNPDQLAIRKFKWRKVDVVVVHYAVGMRQRLSRVKFHSDPNCRYLRKRHGFISEEILESSIDPRQWCRRCRETNQPGLFQINVAEEFQIELAVALQESLRLSYEEATRYTAPIVRYLQQQYGGDELYIPQPYMRRNVSEIIAASDAGVPIKKILRDFSISRRTYYRILSQR